MFAIRYCRYFQVDSDGSGHITVDELGDALKKCNIDLPGYQIRDLIVQYDSRIKDGKLDMEEFKQVIIITGTSLSQVLVASRAQKFFCE